MKTPGHILLRSLPLALFLGLAACGAQATHASPDSRPALDIPESELPKGLVSALDPSDERFRSLFAAILSEPDLVALVNKEHGLARDYEPRDLVSLNTLSPPLVLNRKDLSLRRKAADALVIMARSARKDGVILDISSSYRSWTYQEGLFARYVKELGRKEAERQSARPGTSQHQLGTAVDFGSVTPEFASSPAGKWLSAHARDYGFSLSYPEDGEALTGYMYEPWHYRFIGIPATTLEKECFAGSQETMLRFLNRYRKELEAWTSVSGQP